MWNLPTYTVPMDIEAVHQLPSYCKEAPLVDDRNPIEVKVVPASKYRGPPAMPVRIEFLPFLKRYQNLPSCVELLSNEQKNTRTVFDHRQ